MNPVKKRSLRLVLFFSLGIISQQSEAQSQTTLIKKQEINMPHVKGDFDLMAYDAAGKRLFLAAQDNHSVEVFNLKNNKHTNSLPGFEEPKWVFYHATSNILYVATAKDGKVTAVNASTFKTLKTYRFKQKCNNLRYDPATQQLFVGVGQNFGAIGIIDLKLQKVTGNIALADYPKQFELTNDRIYVNVPGKSLIQVIDRKTAKVIADWPVKCNKDNIPMAIDRAGKLLFIGCGGGQLVVHSMITGREVGRIGIHKDVDGVYFDARRSRVYVSCSEGFVDVFSTEKGKLKPLQQIPTRSLAGTALLIPSTDQYILAEPQTETLPAAIQIFQPVN